MSPLAPCAETGRLLYWMGFWTGAAVPLILFFLLAVLTRRRLDQAQDLSAVVHQILRLVKQLLARKP